MKLIVECDSKVGVQLVTQESWVRWISSTFLNGLVVAILRKRVRHFSHESPVQWNLNFVSKLVLVLWCLCGINLKKLHIQLMCHIITTTVPCHAQGALRSRTYNLWGPQLFIGVWV